MSTMYTVEGGLLFKSCTTYERVVDDFKRSGLMTPDGRFRTQDSATPQTPDGDTDTDDENWAIKIPFNTYRNFFYIEEETLGNADTYGVVWTCTDGMFKGGYETHEGGVEYNLDDWAVENGFEKMAPDFETDESFEEYVQWQSEVEAAFFEDHSHVIPGTSPE